MSAFVVFIVVTAITPGPNTILALSTGSRRGFRGSLPVLAGICAGFFCVMSICAFLSFSFSVLSPLFVSGMQYIGCIYILWLAWKVATARISEKNDTPGTGFASGFILQFVNVKIMIYGMTSYSVFILPYDDSLFMLFGGVCILSLVGSAGTVIWAFAGAMLQHVFQKHARLMNALMGMLLLGCALSLLHS